MAIRSRALPPFAAVAPRDDRSSDGHGEAETFRPGRIAVLAPLPCGVLCMKAMDLDS